MFTSAFNDMGQVIFPPFSGIRILMMPIVLEDLERSLPSWLSSWKKVLNQIIDNAPTSEGIGYLTIDERKVPAYESHRRPGLHVDGWCDDVDDGGWGGGGWGKNHFLTAASHLGCRVWLQEFAGQPQRYGSCEHLRSQLQDINCYDCLPQRLYKLENLCVHESYPLTVPAARQFIRLSMPSNAGWPVSCTPNPLGIKPTGKYLLPRPVEFTEYGDNKVFEGR